MPSSNATVIAAYSRRMRLRLDDGARVDARIKGKTLKPVCGDEVVAETLDDEEDWLITGILERRNELSRPNARGETEVLAANVDMLVVVAAATPKPDWFIVDRYLCAAELMGVAAAVVYNKTDLDVPDSVDAALSAYASIGYETIRVSARGGDGLDELATLLGGRTAIVVGQSGVGKSSIINQLSDAAEQKTATISGKRGEGKHTTVNSVMIALRSGGTVIDSPGVRDYAPALQSADDAQVGFREISVAAHECRFANCRHRREPDCAVKAGVEAGRIDARRYESFRRALALAERLGKGKY